MKRLSRNPSVVFFFTLQCLILLGILSALLASRVNSGSVLEGNTVIREHTEEILSLVVNNTHNHTKVLLEPAESSVLLSHSLLQDEQINPDDDLALERYFLKQLKTHKQFSGMYFGRPDGSFIFVNRENNISLAQAQGTTTTNFERLDSRANGFRTKVISFLPERNVKYTFRNNEEIIQYSELDPNDIYDPRERSWYQKANQRISALQNHETAIWTEPYIFFDSQKPGITTAKTVINKNGINAGTVGIDIELSDLSHYLETITLSENKSFPFIKTADNVVIAFPNFESYLNTRTSQTLPFIHEIGNEISQSFADLKNGFESNTVVDFKVAEADYIGTLQPIQVLDKQEWLLGIYAPKDVYIGNISNHYQKNLLRIIAIGFLLSCLAVPISLAIAKPLKRLQQRATTDPLTTLLNRDEFDRQAELLKTKAERSNVQIAYLMLDLDNFKPVNDIYGHHAGDEVLQIVAKRLQDSIKEEDIVGRYGGDEFAICLFDVNSENIFEIVERIRTVIEEPAIVTSKGTHHIGSTAGAVLSEGSFSHTLLIGFADSALIKGKTIAKGTSYITKATLEPKLETSTSVTPFSHSKKPSQNHVTN